MLRHAGQPGSMQHGPVESYPGLLGRLPISACSAPAPGLPLFMQDSDFLRDAVRVPVRTVEQPSSRENAAPASPSEYGPTTPTGKKQCLRCGTSTTPVWRPAVLRGPKILCNACGLKKDTLRAMHGTPDGKPSPSAPLSPRSPRIASAAMMSPQLRSPGRPPRHTPKSALKGARASQVDNSPARRRLVMAPPDVASPSRYQTRSVLASPERGLTRPLQEVLPPRPPAAAAAAGPSLLPPTLTAPPQRRQPPTPLSTEGSAFRTPIRARPILRGPISPATSNDARTLMFLSQWSAPEAPREAVRHAPKSAPKTTPGNRTMSISERNRAAAMARWHSAEASTSCRKCGLDLNGATAGRGMCEGCNAAPGSRKRKAIPAAEPRSPLTRSVAFASLGERKDNGQGADSDDEEFLVEEEEAAQKSGKKQRRASAAAAATAARDSAKKDPKRGPGRPPKWPERAEVAQREAAATALPGDFASVDQIWVSPPGRAPFQLARLRGAPHGQPALALRQVQVALVPHTDRTSAFYLAMIRAAEAVGGLVRTATRPEMHLLVRGAALAKGACRASIGTFPAVAKGLARLGVDDATIEALLQHDQREKPSAADPDAAAADVTADRQDAAAAEAVPVASPPNPGRRAARSVRTPASAAGPTASALKRSAHSFKTPQGAAPAGASPEQGISAASADTAARVCGLTTGGSEGLRSARHARKAKSGAPEEALLSDGGSSPPAKQRRISFDSCVGVRLNDMRIHPGWLPLLQQAPSAAMQAAFLVMQQQPPQLRQAGDEQADGAGFQARMGSDAAALSGDAAAAAMQHLMVMAAQGQAAGDLGNCARTACDATPQEDAAPHKVHFECSVPSASDDVAQDVVDLASQAHADEALRPPRPPLRSVEYTK